MAQCGTCPWGSMYCGCKPPQESSLPGTSFLPSGLQLLTITGVPLTFGWQCPEPAFREVPSGVGEQVTAWPPPQRNRAAIRRSALVAQAAIVEPQATQTVRSGNRPSSAAQLCSHWARYRASATLILDLPLLAMPAATILPSA